MINMDFTPLPETPESYQMPGPGTRRTADSPPCNAPGILRVSMPEISRLYIVPARHRNSGNQTSDSSGQRLAVSGPALGLARAGSCSFATSVKACHNTAHRYGLGWLAYGTDDTSKSIRRIT